MHRSSRRRPFTVPLRFLFVSFSSQQEKQTVRRKRHRGRPPTRRPPGHPKALRALARLGVLDPRIRGQDHRAHRHRRLPRRGERRAGHEAAEGAAEGEVRAARHVARRHHPALFRGGGVQARGHRRGHAAVRRKVDVRRGQDGQVDSHVGLSTASRDPGLPPEVSIHQGGSGGDHWDHGLGSLLVYIGEGPVGGGCERNMSARLDDRFIWSCLNCSDL